MWNSAQVERLPANWTEDAFDLTIGAVGYERRARHIFESFNVSATLKAAAAFPKQQVFDFKTNWDFFEQNGFEVQTVNDDEYAGWLSFLIEQIRRPTQRVHPDEIHIMVDISSLTRTRIADIVSTVCGIGSTNCVRVDFVYSLAAFTPPSVEQPSNTHVGPVTRNFAGWWKEPERILSAVVGIGYEQDKALGAVEYLQAQDVWSFQPESKEVAYTDALNKANETLLKTVRNDHHFTYRVHDPMDCFSRLKSLVRGLTKTNNVILLPFGPKIFVLCTLLVAAGDSELAVWRVSAQTDEEPINRIGTDYVYGLRVTFGSKNLIQ